MPSPESQTIADEVLVAEAQTGDAGAFEALVERYQSKVYRLAVRMTGDEHEAENILQDTFLQVFKKLSSFRGDAQFSTWLYRITTNAALMNIRARRLQDAGSLQAYLPEFDGTGTHRRLDVDYTAAARVQEIIEQHQLMALIKEALIRLPAIYRAAFVLYDLEELPANEAAEILRVEPATIRQRVHRARLMLRGYLGQISGGEV